MTFRWTRLAQAVIVILCSLLIAVMLLTRGPLEWLRPEHSSDALYSASEEKKNASSSTAQPPGQSPKPGSGRYSADTTPDSKSSGALLLIAMRPTRRPIFAAQVDVLSSDGIQHYSCLSDLAGHVLLPLPDDHDALTIRCSAAGFETKEMSCLSGRAIPGEMLLLPTSGFVGALHDRNGRPIQGGSVYGWFLDESPWLPTPSQSSSPIPALRFTRQKEAARIESVTSVEGEFFVEPSPLALGGLLVLAYGTDQECGVLRVPLPHPGVLLAPITCDPLVRQLRGTVVDEAGSALNGVAVCMGPAELCGSRFPPQWHFSTAYSLPDGSFAISAGPKPVAIGIVDSTYRLMTDDGSDCILISEGLNHVSLRARRRITASGRIVESATNVPISGASVIVENGETDPLKDVVSLETRSSVDGQFTVEVTGVRLVNPIVRIRAAGYHATQVALDGSLLGLGAGRRDIPMEQEHHSIAVAGVVRYDSRAMADCHVYLLSEPEVGEVSRLWGTRTAPDGTFSGRIPPRDAGNLVQYWLVAGQEHVIQGGRDEWIVPAAIEGPLDLLSGHSITREIQLHPTHTLSVRVEHGVRRLPSELVVAFDSPLDVVAPSLQFRVPLDATTSTRSLAAAFQLTVPGRSGGRLWLASSALSGAISGPIRWNSRTRTCSIRAPDTHKIIVQCSGLSGEQYPSTTLYLLSATSHRLVARRRVLDESGVVFEVPTGTYLLTAVVGVDNSGTTEVHQGPYYSVSVEGDDIAVRYDCLQ